MIIKVGDTVEVKRGLNMNNGMRYAVPLSLIDVKEVA